MHNIPARITVAVVSNFVPSVKHMYICICYCVTQTGVCWHIRKITYTNKHWQKKTRHLLRVKSQTFSSKSFMKVYTGLQMAVLKRPWILSKHTPVTETEILVGKDLRDQQVPPFSQVRAIVTTVMSQALASWVLKNFRHGDSTVSLGHLSSLASLDHSLSQQPSFKTLPLPS